jgi:alkyl hydroperoxide reductase subunit D
MEFLKTITDRIPDHAKDVRLNIGSVLSRSSLEPEAALGVALAAAYAAKCKPIVDAIRGSGQMSEAELNGAVSAAALMGMNNVWYPYVEMTENADLKSQPAGLRMNAYASHGGVDKRRFEMYALAASIIGKCHFCVKSHYENLVAEGMSTTQLRDVGRIAAVINAVALTIEAEGK